MEDRVNQSSARQFQLVIRVAYALQYLVWAKKFECQLGKRSIGDRSLSIRLQLEIYHVPNLILPGSPILVSI